MADEEKKSAPKVEEKQEPEKPKRKKKEGGGLSLPVMIIVGLGAVVIQVVLVVAVLKFVFPQGEDAHASDSTATAKGQEEKKDEHGKKSEKEIDYDEYEDVLSKMEDIHYVETGKIITNPKGASSIFVVANFALEFKKMDKENEELKKMIDDKGEIKVEEPLYKKLMATTKNTINRLIASYTVEELQAKRLELTDQVKKELRPVYRDFELVIVKVNLVEFIIQ